MSNLHPTTWRVYDFIIRFKQMNGGDSPTYREIADGAMLESHSHVREHLDKLAGIGFIKISRQGLARRIAVKGASWQPPGGNISAAT